MRMVVRHTHTHRCNFKITHRRIIINICRNHFSLLCRCLHLLLFMLSLLLSMSFSQQTNKPTSKWYNNCSVLKAAVKKKIKQKSHCKHIEMKKKENSEQERVTYSSCFTMSLFYFQKPFFSMSLQTLQVHFFCGLACAIKLLFTCTFFAIVIFCLCVTMGPFLQYCFFLVILKKNVID